MAYPRSWTNVVFPALMLACFDAAPATQPSKGPASKSATQPVASGPATRPVQADDGSILLHARDVTIHGTTVRYEPDPHKNTVGYWTRKEDWVSWEFDVKRAGKFNVVILQGCGKESGGSEVEFSIGEQRLKMTVEETGGFQTFVSRSIGAVELSAGTHSLSVKPLTKPGLAVMDLRQVTLEPAR